MPRHKVRDGLIGAIVTGGVMLGMAALPASPPPAVPDYQRLQLHDEGPHVPSGERYARTRVRITHGRGGGGRGGRITIHVRRYAPEEDIPDAYAVAVSSGTGQHQPS